jgi:alkanesulfonate monooxygenase SsuD/methylene tetrahydromethanopterin reductase-like flavin-dependent oxidoreductase (luciferase family)
MRPVRFGVEMMAPFEGRTWAESARDLEDLGYSTLFVPDHFDEGYGPITAMASAAAATRSLRVASAVFAVDFRHPAVLARELASIDALSEGRLELGLGAGYQVADYRASGISMDPPGARVSRLIEYVEVLRGLFADGVLDFDAADEAIAPLAAAMGASADTALDSPVALVGSVDEIVERLHLRRERWGYTYYTVQQPVAHVFSAVIEALGR